MQSTATSPQSTDEPRSEGEPSTAELTLDTVFEILSNERRRRTCRYLLDNQDGVRLGPLAEHIASVENDKQVAEITSQERKRVYVGLYQCHLPKMDGADVVDFDADRKSIESGENIEQVTTYLPETEDAKRARGGGLTTTFSDFVRSVGGWL